ncbi:MULTISPECIES: SDR family NAD(P)-dependent oxidoreductase [Shinella]|uniref:SDR family oxidoreductase n=1 Tax=Shinella sedimenti TaxID=2919913 RepID=A0ABT0CQ63_9HYPH|nr:MULTISPECIES: SDR family oxidoreductase [Shinella]MCJ8150750.1 SDR family oxidoreductase [Shinella sedimenti]
MFDLSNKVALVTGGNGGIGLAMAKALHSAGATVAIVGRDLRKNDEASLLLSSVNGDPGLALVADTTDERQVAAMVEQVVSHYGRLDIVINNVGTNDRKLPQEYSLAEWNALISINLTTAFLVSQQVFPQLARNGGKILNVGSMLSLFGSAMSAPYAAAKGGVVQLTKSLAQAWAKDGIQVNAILPGWIDTDLTAGAKVQIPELHGRVLARTPAGRWGKPDDLAGAALFLCSPAADFITGVVLPVDGGYSSNG